ncbi:MAG: hypothetical protein H7333_03945, partial [Bdellovibrionales bacterium]|nr:hypothetical protein [Oligoflexia bacterium]
VQISQRVKEVLQAEKIEFEEASINLIARAAEGSMRDALSILDQVISFSGLKVTAQAVRESIGLIGTELVLTLLRQVLERNAKGALTTVQGAFNQGVDLKILLKSLIEMMHALILMQVGIEKPESNFNDDELIQLATLKTLRPLEEAELIFQVYHHGLDLLSRASQPKLIFDLLVVKTALAEALVKLEDGEWETAPRGSPRQALSAEAHVPTKAHGSSASSVPTSEPPAVATITQVASVLKAPAPTEVPMMQSLSQPAVQPTPAPVAQVAAAKAPVEVTTGPKSWEKFIELTFSKNPMLGIILESVVDWKLPEGTSDDKIRLGFREKDRSKADQLLQKVFKELFSNLAEAYFGFKSVPEVFVTSNNGESVAERTDRLKKEARDEKMSAILSNEIVLEAKSLFGAELSHIEMTEKDG